MNSKDFAMTASTIFVLVSVFLRIIGGDAEFSMFLTMYFILATIYFQLKENNNERVD